MTDLIENEKLEDNMTEGEDEGDDEMIIFDILRESLDGLEAKFSSYYENPTKDTFVEFDQLVKEIIDLFRKLKNVAKTLLPLSEKPKRKPREPKVPPSSPVDIPPKTEPEASL